MISFVYSSVQWKITQSQNTVSKALIGSISLFLWELLRVAQNSTDVQRRTEGRPVEAQDGRLYVFMLFAVAALTGVSSVLTPLGGLLPVGHKRVRCPTEAP